MRRTITVFGGLLVALGVSAGGCASHAKIKVTKTGALNYEQLHVVYDVAPKTGTFRLNEPPAVQQVGMTVASHPDPQSANGRIRLEVRYPCPGVHPAFARATLRVIPQKIPTASRTTAAADNNAADEMLVIDFPKTDLDALLYDLANDGYFESKVPTTAQSSLDVSYNQGRVQKEWTREPRLENLIDILKRHGTPVIARSAG